MISGRDLMWLCDSLQPGTTNPESPAANTVVDLSIAAATPPGLVGGFYNQPSGGTPINTITWTSAASRTDVFYVDIPTAPGTYRVRSSFNGVARESSVVTVHAAPQLAFNKTALNVGRGFRTSSSELIISRNVGGTPVPLSEPVTVALTSSDPSKVSVPATVTIYRAFV